jgi:ABC-type multidrug transport system ATPase subunit
LKSTGICYQ